MSNKERGIKSHKLSASLFLALVVVLLLLLIFIKPSITGNAISLDKKVFSVNNPIDGYFTLALREGELVPSTTRVVARLDGPTTHVKELSLEEFVDMSRADADEIWGEYYLEDAALDGSGFGYGWPGKHVVYPDIKFNIRVAKEGAEEQEAPVREGKGRSAVSFLMFFNRVFNLWSAFAVLEETRTSKIIEAKCNANDPFYYNLKEGEKTELVSGTVSSGGKRLGDSEVLVSEEGLIAMVSTDYYESYQGFGELYLGSEKRIFLDISPLDIRPSQLGTYSFEISLVYNNKEIASLAEDVAVKELAPLSLKVVNRNGQVKDQVVVDGKNIRVRITKRKEFGEKIYKIITGWSVGSSVPETEISFVDFPDNTVIQIDEPIAEHLRDGIRTEIFAVEPSNKIKINSARITLEKIGDVNAIFECPKWDVNSFRCLSGWKLFTTDFEDYRDHVSFTTTHFTAYGGGTADYNANLTIWDLTDSEGGSQIVYKYQNNSFYANYTNKTSGESINGSGDYCEFSENSSGSWSAAVNMTFNATSLLYEDSKNMTYSGTHYFNVTCQSPNYNLTTAIDDFEINESIAIDNCTNLSSAGSYILIQHVSGDCNIGTNNVNLNCDNHNISGELTTTSGVNNATVRNCIVPLITYTAVTNGLIQNNTFFVDSDMGIFIQSTSSSIEVSDNSFISTVFVTIGIYDTSTNISIINNDFDITAPAKQAFAIFTDGSTLSNLSDNTIDIIDCSCQCYGTTGALESGKTANNNEISISGDTCSGSTQYGLHLATSNSEISGNDINITNSDTSGAMAGIWLSGNSNTITSNTITTSGFAVRGIWLVNNGNSNTITSNTITTSINYSGGLFVGASNTITNNTITTSSSNSNALVITGDGNIIQDSSIETTGSGSHAVYHNSVSSDTNFIDSTVTATAGSGSSSYDVVFSSSDNQIVNFTNTTSNKNFDVSTGSGTQINVRWYTEVYVNDSDGGALESATVNFYDTNSNLRFLDTTDSSGMTSRYNVTEFYEISSGRTYYTNYSASVSKSGYEDNSKFQNITENNLNYDFFVTLTAEDGGGGGGITPCIKKGEKLPPSRRCCEGLVPVEFCTGDPLNPGKQICDTYCVEVGGCDTLVIEPEIEYDDSKKQTILTWDIQEEVAYEIFSAYRIEDFVEKPLPAAIPTSSGMYVDSDQARLKFYRIRASIVYAHSGVCQPICLYKNTYAEGWYDSCSQELIKQKTCRSCTSRCLDQGTSDEGWYAECTDKDQRELIKIEECSKPRLCAKESKTLLKFKQHLVHNGGRIGVPGDRSINWIMNLFGDESEDYLWRGGIDYVAEWKPEKQEQYGSAHGILRLYEWFWHFKTFRYGGVIITGPFEMDYSKPYFVGATKTHDLVYVDGLPKHATFHFKTKSGTFNYNYIILPLDTKIKTAKHLCERFGENGINIMRSIDTIDSWDPDKQKFGMMMPCSRANFDLEPGTVYRITITNPGFWTQE